MEQNNILALDLGTTMGWAAYCSGDINSGKISFKGSRYEGGGMRFLRLKMWLEEIYTLLGDVNAVYYEEVRRHLGTDAAHLYGGFLATLSSWCEQKGIPYTGIPVATIKKNITNKGNASKKDVIGAIKAKGYDPSDDNEADAIAILLCAIEPTR